MEAANPNQSPAKNSAALTANETANRTTQVVIYADGSCLKNGTAEARAGAGIVLMTEDRQRIKLKACFLGQATNQQAEILACAVALESLKTACCVRIFSDSKYVVETMLGRNRMKTNREFWSRLVSACLTHHVEWNWTRGHAGCAFQETADRLARAATQGESLNQTTLQRLAKLLQGQPDAETVRMIHDGLKTLAAACDGAQRTDRQGFNKLDSELGKRFAAKTELTAAESLVARKFLGKYRGQIQAFDRQLALIV